jgi:hypothetical protein
MLRNRSQGRKEKGEPFDGKDTGICSKQNVQEVSGVIRFGSKSPRLRYPKVKKLVIKDILDFRWLKPINLKTD